MKNIDDFLLENGIKDTDYLTAMLKAYFEAQEWNWNDTQIIGMRMTDDYDDEFSDWFIIYKDGIPIAVKGSTKPGAEKAGKGSFVLKEGQVKGMWRKGTTTWSGDDYLQQVQPCTGYVDNSGGASIDRDSTTKTGLFGINFHSWKGIGESIHVYNVSEGCQVTDEEENKVAFEVINQIVGDIDSVTIFTPNFLTA
jgi:hypothetical protein